MQRSHARRAGIVAALIELVVIAVVANQWATTQWNKHASTDEYWAVRVLRNAALSTSWRFTPQHNFTMVWLGSVLADVVIVVLVLLIVGVVVAGMRRPAPFIATWLGTWALVLLAVVVAAVVRILIQFQDLTLTAAQRSQGRFWFAVNDGLDSPIIVFGVLTGFVAGLGAAIAARTAGGPPAPAPEPQDFAADWPAEPEPPPPPPWYGEPVPAPGAEQPTEAFASSRFSDTHATEVLGAPPGAVDPAADEVTGYETQQLPRAEQDR